MSLCVFAILITYFDCIIDAFCAGCSKRFSRTGELFHRCRWFYGLSVVCVVVASVFHPDSLAIDVSSWLLCFFPFGLCLGTIVVDCWSAAPTLVQPAAAPEPRRQVRFSGGCPQGPPSQLPCNTSIPGRVLDRDSGQLPTRPCNGTLTSTAGLPAISAVVFILCFVAGAQAFPASRSRAQDSATTNINVFLPRPEFPPFPGIFAQGVIVGIKDKLLPGLAATISVLFVALGFLHFTDSFGWDIFSVLGYKKVPPLPTWFLVFMAVFGTCFLGLCGARS